MQSVEYIDKLSKSSDEFLLIMIVMIHIDHKNALRSNFSGTSSTRALSSNLIVIVT